MSLKSRLRAVLSRVREFFLSLFPFISPLPSNGGFLYTPSIRFRVAFGVSPSSSSSSSSSSSRLLNKSTGGQRGRSRVEPDRRPGTRDALPPHCPQMSMSPPPPSAIIQFQKWRERREESRPLSYFTTANRPNEIPPSPAAFLLTT